MRKAIAGVILLAAGIGIGATSQPAVTIQDLRQRRAELEKTIAVATAELRQVNASIARLGKAETFPISHLEEAKAKLTAVQYEQAKAMKFAGFVVATPGNRAWHQGVFVKATTPAKIGGVTAHCRFLVQDANAAYQVLETDSDLAIGPAPTGPLSHDHVPAAWLANMRDRPLVNAHVVVSIGGVPIYEAVAKPEKTPLAPNGIPWWRDALLTGDRRLDTHRMKWLN